jgi:glycosyltransferase involved in cell wall biosynthesis
MPVCGRNAFLRHSIRLFLDQDYSNRELIIVDGPDATAAASIPDHPLIQYHCLPLDVPSGAARSFGFQYAKGAFLAFWDDDDWHAPSRLSTQLAPLIANRCDLTALDTGLFLEAATGRFWRCANWLHERMFACNVNGKTLVFSRRAWAAVREYPENLSAGEDAAFLQEAIASGVRLQKLPNTGLFIYVRHCRNAWQFRPGGHENPDGWTAIAPDAAQSAIARAYQEIAQHATFVPRPASVPDADPLVTCAMPTADRRDYVPRAIRQFLNQDYANRELLILDDGSDPVADLVPDDPRIRYQRLELKLTVGAKRNLAASLANGEFIIHWDDDDWMANWRIRYQLESLRKSGAEVCGLNRFYYHSPDSGEAWEYIYPPHERPWLAGGTLCYRRQLAFDYPFRDVNVGEDNAFVWSLPQGKLLPLDNRDFYVATVHSGNTSPKQIEPDRWHRRPLRLVQKILDPARSPSRNPQRALLAAGQGIGDILRTTPLVRVLAELG